MRLKFLHLLPLKWKLPQGRFLAPQWLAVVTNDGIGNTYRIRQHWDGRKSLDPLPVPSKEACFIVLDPDVPFRRKLQKFPETKKAQQALLRAAADEFPFTAGAVDFSLGVRNGEGYLYALPHDKRSQIDEITSGPKIVLSAKEPLSENTCLEALQEYEKFGSIVAFGSTRRYLSRRFFSQLLLSIGLAFNVIVGGYVLLAPNLFGGIIEWQLERIRITAGNLPKTYAATEAMIAAREAMVGIQTHPNAKLPSILGKLFVAIPPNCAIKNVELKDNILTVAGTGSDVLEWLKKSGFREEDIKTESIGNYSHFQAKQKI